MTERGPAQLVRDRAALWSRRSDKWHGYLERERAWSSRAITMPIIFGTVGVAFGIGLRQLGHAVAAQLLCMVIAGLFSWRGSVAKTRLEGSRASEAWVTADRLAEVYRGLVAELDDATNDGRPLVRGDVVLEVLDKSQRLEAGARFGLPDRVRAALDDVTTS